MTEINHLNSLYSAPIVIWVEDDLTRDYLKIIWGNPTDIRFLIAGGRDSIPTIVRAAKQEGLNHVYGILDRDFGFTNQPKWSTIKETSRLYYIPRHEIENYFLDANALVQSGMNNCNHSLSEVDNELKRLAHQQVYWLACRRIMSKLRQELLSDYPEHPKVGAIQSLADAESYLSQSNWYKNLPSKVQPMTAAGLLQSDLQAAETEYTAALSNGSWLTGFSGKEIFRQIRSYIYQPSQSPGDPDNDVAKAIGIWQLKNHQAPQDLLELRSYL